MMGKRAKSLLRFTLRWGIAVVGVYWVVTNISLRDRLTMVDADGRLSAVTLAQEAREDSSEYRILDSVTGQPRTISREQTANRPDRKQVMLRTDRWPKAVKLLGLDLQGDINRKPRVSRFLVEEGGKAKWVGVLAVENGGNYQPRVPYPRIDKGLSRMVKESRPQWLWAAVLIFPVTFLICGFRWYKLLEALGIQMGLGRAFVLTMVGTFYNTFMPGSTGGDVLKAWYAAKQTSRRTQAVMSVFVDRLLGLLSLVMLGGVMAAFQYLKINNPADAVAQSCGHVAMISVAILSGAGLVFFVFFRPHVRRALRLDELVSRLPMQSQVQKAMEVMEAYRNRPGLVFWALIVTLPVHITVVLSAMLAGQAFGLPISSGYYFIVVPVVVLVGAIPISPQGAGVMEFFAIHLTQREGATIGQAVALTMSIRMVQIFWNLAGGIFVLRGGYHAPTAMERQSLDGELVERAG